MPATPLYSSTIPFCTLVMTWAGMWLWLESLFVPSQSVFVSMVSSKRRREPPPLHLVKLAAMSSHNFRGQKGHTAEFRAGQRHGNRHSIPEGTASISSHVHAHAFYLGNRGLVPLTGGGFMHHPLGKQFFQPHVVIQDHLQERALDGGGNRRDYTGAPPRQPQTLKQSQ